MLKALFLTLEKNSSHVKHKENYRKLMVDWMVAPLTLTLSHKGRGNDYSAAL
jgi:hypothetical protein